jgi:hypothetical protein
MRYVKQSTNEVVGISAIRKENPNMSIPEDADCSALGYKKLVLTPPPAEVGFHPVEVAPVNNVQQWELVADVVAVPDSITARQARLVLLNKGFLDEVETLVASNRVWQIEWEYASEIERNNALISEMQSQIGLTDAHVDELFIEGSKL